MDTSITAAIAAGLRGLPPDGAERNLRLQRLTDLYAAAEAADALRAAAARARETRDPLADVLTASDTLWAVVGVPHAGEPVFGEAQVEARHRLSHAIVGGAFQRTVAGWSEDLREIADRQPSTGACTVATALKLWSWTLSHVLQTFDVVERDVALAELAEALSRLVAARAHVLTVSASERSAGVPASDPQFFEDLCHVQTAQASGRVAALCAEIVFGHRAHPAWDGAGCASCYGEEDLDALEGLVPGIASVARAYSDVIEADGSHPAKAGPCAKLDGVDAFARLRTKLDGCLTGARLAKRRAADALPGVCVGA
jgi:hypothetical protein